MEVSTSTTGETSTISLSGVIDEAGATQLKSNLESLNLDSIKAVNINFSGVERIGSAGIGKLLLFYKRTGMKGVTVNITNASTSIYELLTDLNLNSLFNISK